MTLSDDVVVTAATTLAKRLSMSIRDYIELVGITEGQKIKLDGSGKHTFYLTSKGVMDENGFAVKAAVVEVKNYSNPSTRFYRINISPAPKKHKGHIANFVCGVTSTDPTGWEQQTGNVVTSLFLVGDIRDLGLAVFEPLTGFDEWDTKEFIWAGIAFVPIPLFDVVKGVYKVLPDGALKKMVGMLIENAFKIYCKTRNLAEATAEIVKRAPGLKAIFKLGGNGLTFSRIYDSEDLVEAFFKIQKENGVDFAEKSMVLVGRFGADVGDEVAKRMAHVLGGISDPKILEQFTTSDEAVEALITLISANAKAAQSGAAQIGCNPEKLLEVINNPKVFNADGKNIPPAEYIITLAAEVTEGITPYQAISERILNQLFDAGLGKKWLGVGSRKALRSALAPPKTGCEAHHIVPIAAGEKTGDAIRKILREAEIDINSAFNGAWAEFDYHKSLHTNDYIRKLFGRLKAAELRGGATEAGRTASIVKELEIIKNVIENSGKL